MAMMLKAGWRTMTDLARAVGRHPSSIWFAVNNYGLVPAPTHKIGKRFYYSKDEFDRIVMELEVKENKAAAGE
jgi:hypothetical protein